MNRTMTALGTSISRRQLVGGMMAAAVAAPIVASRTRGVAFAEASEIKDGTYTASAQAMNDLLEVSVTITDGKIAVLDLMLACKLIPSKGEGRRLVQQGGVMVNEEKVESIDASYTAEQLKEGLKIRKGKKVYHKAILK